jgi:hypothetical protein
MEISQFLGTCASEEIGNFALKYGKPSSYNNAKKAIKKYNIDLYNELQMDFFNPWHEHTNIKTVKGEKYLHVVYSCIDYIFKIN